MHNFYKTKKQTSLQKQLNITQLKNTKKQTRHKKYDIAQKYDPTHE